MKTYHIQIPEELYVEFHKLFPRHGDKAHFLRQAIVRAIKNADKRDHFANVKLGKEVDDE